MSEIKNWVIGSGFFGAVVAERIATVLNEPVCIVEKRNHIGGNSYSKIDPETDIEFHQYGSHIFHTSCKEVWDYVNQFADFTNYRHKVLTRHNGNVFFMPMNLKTINEFFKTDLTPEEAKKFLAERAAHYQCSNPQNFEEKAISMIGPELYDAFIRGYTAKQWERDPRLLPASIINRLPVRLNYNIDYFGDKWQGVPREGYGQLFKHLLSHPNISIRLNTDYFDIRDQIPTSSRLIYTGMIDRFFNCCFGALEWRSLRFEWEKLPIHDFQGTTVMNYADTNVPFTRIHEFKHYHPERTEVFNSKKTLICREYSQTYHPGSEAYYPINTPDNQLLLKRYQTLLDTPQNRHIILGGRLGSYRYWDMDKTIENALKCFNEQINTSKK